MFEVIGELRRPSAQHAESVVGKHGKVWAYEMRDQLCSFAFGTAYYLNMLFVCTLL